jgi:hypothetical protein
MPVVSEAQHPARHADMTRWLWRAGIALALPYAVLVGLVARGWATTGASDPLPWLLGQPFASTGVLLVDLAAHVWLFVAAVWICRETGGLIPSLSAIRTSLERRQAVLLITMFALVLVEHLPRGLWRAIAEIAR